MAKSAHEKLRAELRAALSKNSARLRRALREALAAPIPLEEGEQIRFEIETQDYRISLCATEEDMLPEYWLSDALPPDWWERGEEVCLPLVSDELGLWFADCWEKEGGPKLYSPAYLFYHGCYAEYYDLDQRRWIHFDIGPEG